MITAYVEKHITIPSHPYAEMFPMWIEMLFSHVFYQEVREFKHVNM